MPPRDDFAAQGDAVWQQGRMLMKITPSDTVDLPRIPKALLCTNAGNIAVIALGGNKDVDGETDLGAAIVIPVGAGDVFDACRISRVKATGTTATIYGIL
jgi:hypothetical protein